MKNKANQLFEPKNINFTKPTLEFIPNSGEEDEDEIEEYQTSVRNHPMLTSKAINGFDKGQRKLTLMNFENTSS